jgi:crotonobetainyl-CoA:carnitine CoA-transferase CaiB-like acyl-CoA transferase
MSQLPLDGIRVVDASRVLAGPFATMLLGDLGADVVKVEPPDGDESRAWGPPWWGDPADRRSAYFASVNRNKRSVVLDLRTHGGGDDFERLLATADILVHNYLPASAARLGLGADGLRARHPDLIVATVAGFSGADADRPSYDLLAQAMSGLMAITGDPDGPPMKVGVAVIDLLAGLECAIGALAALVGRGRTRTVSVSLIDAGLTGLINVLGSHLVSGEEPRRQGNAHASIAPYQSFAARDGHVVIAVGNDGQFRRLLDALGLRDYEGRYATNPQRVAAREELAASIESVTRARTRADLLGALRAADVPAGPVNSVGEALSMMGDGWTRSKDGIGLAPGPIRLDGDAPAPRLPPPRLGEHTASVLRELDERIG